MATTNIKNYNVTPYYDDFDKNDNWGKLPELGESSDGQVYGWVSKDVIINILEGEGFSCSEVEHLLPKE